jgi:adenine-specific DNA-methyltransferase
VPTNDFLSKSAQRPPSQWVAAIPSADSQQGLNAIREPDTPEIRKARGAFFTPSTVVRFMTNWAIRDAGDRVLEPSCGDAEFLVHAVERLHDLGVAEPEVSGVEIHSESAATANARITDAGGKPHIQVSDFFAVERRPTYTAAVGNPPYIRFSGWAGEARDRSRSAAAEAGVKLSGLASSWAAFTVHATSFLAPGGRMALVLPAELLSVGYAAPVRAFILRHFASVELVAFAEQVFVEAEVDVVLLLADGYGAGPAGCLIIRQAQNAESLVDELPFQAWTPTDPSAKWTPALMEANGLALYTALTEGGAFTELETWGDTTLGIVTGNNRYFALSPARVEVLGLAPDDLLPMSPPGSRHLRGLELSADGLSALGASGKATWLFRPSGEPSEAARAYIAAGENEGVDGAYKCRVRRTWWRVPLLNPADLIITCMNADTARITANSAGAHHVNSVHGIYLHGEHRELGRELLAIASLNTMTLLGAEIVGRAYGGGILKLEPGEADVLPVPGPALVAGIADELRAVQQPVLRYLQRGRLLDAVALVDDVLLRGALGVTEKDLSTLRRGHAELTRRRANRSHGA